MNGAMAEPSVMTINKPNNSMTSIMGISQNFLRNFKYAQNSLIKDNKTTSELILHGTDRYLSLNPIIIGLFIDFLAQQIFPGSAHA